MNERGRLSTKSPMIKSDSFQRQPSLVRTSSSKQNRTNLPPPTARVNTMKPIHEQKVYNHKPVLTNKKRHHSRRLNNTSDDDIPLALLAYKKGYTTIYPSTRTVKDDRTDSYLSTSSSGSSSQNSIIKQQETKRKKSRRLTTPVPVEKKVIEEPIIKEKKWYSSLRKLIK
ncbi:hypothetical protein HPULCUR_008360 [Helicostylum pulchrum]|uniref:Uncharacterized protein n=1 Tax=Helicostylum pulchrum TaxID=562976 RepID=A0ABP9Y818_9FUNG